ncbi:MAG: hypothetical protein E7317_06995 [Clostridiales bacterium]|nr:hypothetical protein [Clostridiales bacterium]
MFGIIRPDLGKLDDDARARYRRCYCGVCTALHQGYGQLGRMTLSYDLTFLALLLDALYAEEEQARHVRCPVHALRGVDALDNEYMRYAADLNIALSYYKLLDDWRDDKNVLSRGSAALVKRYMAAISARYPRQIKAIESWISLIHSAESSGDTEIDVPVNLTGDMLAELFCYREDVWAGELRGMGDALGRFIYFMDAYEDVKRDERRGSFNALKPLAATADYEALCRHAMEAMMADCVQAFEVLPIVRNVDILRSVLYAGVWAKYNRMHRTKGNGETQHEQ